MSSAVREDTSAQLMAMKALTQTTGVLHEAQILQLKCWPRVIAPRAKSYEVKVEVERHWVGIYYQFGMFHKPPKNFEEGTVAVDEWIKTLLGDEWLVEIYSDYGKGPKQTYIGVRKAVQSVYRNGSPGTSDEDPLG